MNANEFTDDLPGTVHQKREDQLSCLNSWSPQFVSLRNQRLD